MARRLTPVMQFYRDVQKLAPENIPFRERAALARFAKKKLEAGVHDPRQVVAEYFRSGKRPNPDRPIELLLAGGVGALLVYLLLRRPESQSQPQPQTSPTTQPAGGCGCL
jgi:hypothetical protein